MNIRTAVIFAFVLTTIASVTIAQQMKVVCYYGSWATYRPGNGKFNVSADLDPSLCTHVVYSFISANSDGSIKILDKWNDIDLGGFKNFVGLRSKFPTVKYMVAFGGASEGSATFSALVKSSTLRTKLAQNMLAFLTQYKFDGLDLDWEYPGSNGGAPADKANFVLLVRQLRTLINSTTGTKPLLSAAVGAGLGLLNTAYSAKELSDLLDWIGLMTYDYHGDWDKVTGQNAPLYAASIDQDKTLNGNATVKGWIKAGALASKLVMGAGLYGRSFTLQSSTKAGLGATVSGAGTGGPYLQQKGFLGYNEICENQLAGGWKVTFDTVQQVPYASKSTQWVGYDNVDSIKAKADYIKSNKLAGGMVWSIDTDDFRGICKAGKFPLLTALKKALIP